MKLIINSNQLKILSSNFCLVENKGFHPNRNNLITESMKEFKVKVFFQAYPTEIRVGAHNPASALAIASW